MKTIITRKIGMSNVINQDGAIEPITLLSAEPNIITQVKTIENDGYNALQVGTEKSKRVNKPQINHFKASKTQPKIVREFRTDEIGEDAKVGARIIVTGFEVGNKVKVTSLSKGKGWAGTIKRYNFKRGRKTHGGKSYRRVGSIGSMFPQKIFKGKKMPGRLGHVKVTVHNLTVNLIDNEHNLIGLKGSVPGPKNSVVIVRSEER
ncbi:MAG TPA: 50S ribosomal protein L3 [Candidatus Saccharimonadales bacterium]|jgi:large subunit ribosomal protein L3|nr:50S ribosomal protein L3 [Candidatus Saccharimonadales bacterium]